ncbi:MAG: LPXTG cell wall anchor domain-containing protein, partial [Myxococcales bacterium]|nr:LPXTG cell wall anchor domain-containing protein [Myxococcales bacterium]
APARGTLPALLALGVAALLLGVIGGVIGRRRRRRGRRT